MRVTLVQVMLSPWISVIRSLLAVLQLLVAPLVAGVLALWAGWLALAGEAGEGLPKLLAGQLAAENDEVSSSRGLHVAHLALLVLAGAFAAIAVSWWTWPPMWAMARLLLVVVLVWIVGDSLPRLLATVAPDLPDMLQPAALRTLVPFRPLLRLVNWADHRGRPKSSEARRRDSGTNQRDMLLGLFTLADTTIVEVMTPRIDIVAVDISSNRDEVIATLRSCEHARLLVYDEHPDSVAGVLYAKDMLASMADEQSGTSWHTLIRPAAFVPEGKTLDRQLHDFQRGPSHLAVVVDEFGGTAGIITLEDILEQIVGEIHDEHDTDEVAPIQETADSHLVVEGKTSLAELEGVLGHSFNREDVSTVGGLMLALFGRVPRPGEQVEIDKYRFVADQVVRRRVQRVQVYPLEPVPVESAKGTS
ncbi:MAG: hemolysin family protein [Gemmatimonadota bacterium]